MSSITTDQIIEIITNFKREQNPRFELDSDQKKAIGYPNQPLWILAGPGTGKTEVLTMRCIKHLVVDEIPAKKIIITTFTRRAASQLKNRISTYLDVIRQSKNIDYVNESELRVGTLHSLCQEIMVERRYEEYRNFRLIDDIQQKMFIYESSKLASGTFPDPQFEREFWLSFINCIDNSYTKVFWGYKSEKNSKGTVNVPPKRWKAMAAVQLFNTLNEMNCNLSDFASQDEFKKYLVGAYKDYVDACKNTFICDQSLIQKIFLNFLNHPQGIEFIQGNSETNPGIDVLLVDEYQDTNPIQEMIYLRIAKGIGGNICVVGDDDQGLYRFRGATVEAMVGFGNKIEQITPYSNIEPIQIHTNYRSHPDIVKWLNYYINSHGEQLDGWRAPRDGDLEPTEWTNTNYPAVSRIRPVNLATLIRPERNEISTQAAELINHLIEIKGYEPKDICIIAPSTKLGPKPNEDNSFARAITDALSQYGIEVYNPRSNIYHLSEWIKIFFGALFKILETGTNTEDILCFGSYRNLIRYVNDCKNKCDKFCSDDSEGAQLSEYIQRSRRSISRQRGTTTTPYLKSKTHRETRDSDVAGLMDICYHLLNLKVFSELSEKDAEGSEQLVEVINLIEKYASMPYTDNPLINRNLIRLSGRGRINCRDVSKFYTTFLDYMSIEGYSQSLDEEVKIPPGKVPLLTIHSVKGLEFPIVFAYSQIRSQSLCPRHSHYREEMFGMHLGYGDPNGNKPDIETRAYQDIVRQLYVAYSRGKEALIILNTRFQSNPIYEGYGIEIDNEGEIEIIVPENYISDIYGGDE